MNSKQTHQQSIECLKVLEDLRGRERDLRFRLDPLREKRTSAQVAFAEGDESKQKEIRDLEKQIEPLEHKLAGIQAKLAVTQAELTALEELEKELREQEATELAAYIENEETKELERRRARVREVQTELVDAQAIICQLMAEYNLLFQLSPGDLEIEQERIKFPSTVDDQLHAKGLFAMLANPGLIALSTWPMLKPDADFLAENPNVRIIPNLEYTAWLRGRWVENIKTEWRRQKGLS